jgi:hypothetical protein
MGFAQDTGYIPLTIEEILDDLRVNINSSFGTSYTAESFVGTNHYKFFYAAAQRMQANEVKTSEIFAQIQQYITVTNQMIARPVVTPPGLVAKFLEEGYTASVKPMIDADAGKINVCVDVDDTDPTYADIKLAVNTILKDSVVAGVVSQGTETNSIVISNGQSFDFKFHLPNRISTLLRLTITLSENNQSVIKSTDDIKADLLANIAANYSLGKNFEPQKYYSTADAPWASNVLLEYSTNSGGSYSSAVYNSNFDDLFEAPLGNISIVED